MGTRSMSDVVKNVKTGSPERLRIEAAIDAGNFKLSKEAERYSKRPPYQYTSLEPRNFRCWGDTRESEEKS